MKKKKLKKEIKMLERMVADLAREVRSHQRCCENWKPKTVAFKRWLPVDQIVIRREEHE